MNLIWKFLRTYHGTGIITQVFPGDGLLLIFYLTNDGFRVMSRTRVELDSLLLSDEESRALWNQVHTESLSGYIDGMTMPTLPIRRRSVEGRDVFVHIKGDRASIINPDGTETRVGAEKLEPPVDARFSALLALAGSL